MPTQQDSMRYQGKRRFQQFISNHNSKKKISFEKGFEKSNWENSFCFRTN